MPLTLAVFLVIGSLAAGALFSSTGRDLIDENSVLGGLAPAAATLGIQSAEGASFGWPAAMAARATVAAPATIVLPGGSGGGAMSGQSSVAASAGAVMDDFYGIGYSGAIRDPGSPVGPAFDRSGMILYAVHPGDNLSKIAAYFGISIGTIVSANPTLKANFLRVGQLLSILPTSGVVYTARAGDTIQTISSKFGISEEEIVRFNRSVDFATLDPGSQVIIPGGTANMLAASGPSLPNFNGDFIMPAKGYDWGILHHYNAVDIANSCGTPVVASAEGLVVPDPNIADTPGGWNGGYGNFVLIEHPFGNVYTRYAHLSKILVSPGDYVQQGQEIGLMGDSGDSTGCHVHFEVIGAQNPFAKK